MVFVFAGFHLLSMSLTMIAVVFIILNREYGEYKTGLRRLPAYYSLSVLQTCISGLCTRLTDCKSVVLTFLSVPTLSQASAYQLCLCIQSIRAT